MFNLKSNILVGPQMLREYSFICAIINQMSFVYKLVGAQMRRKLKSFVWCAKCYE